MNKRAVSMAFIMVAIILLLLAFSLLFFIKTVFQKTEQLVPEEKCKVSVAREAMLDKLFISQEKSGHTAKSFASNIECVPLPVSLTGNEEKTLAGLTGIYLEKCWKIFGEGKLSLFSNNGVFCHVCYTLTYDPGTNIDLATALQQQTLGTLRDNYDAAKITGEKYDIIFRYVKTSQIAEQRIFVRPIDKVAEVCAGAEFPSQRRK